ncbi:MAG: amidohydrolase [Clostridia bacterium]|nr:amidohydrolase [Clostridia bacterium]MBR4442890.1 amidohydrolase [Clostridia bacterium]
MTAEVIDFHAHPGYDFHRFEHGVDITAELFRGDLIKNGITRACGSVICSSVTRVPPEGQGEVMRELNRRALAYREAMKGFYVPGIHVHPAFVSASCEEIEKASAQGVRLIGELVPYMTGWKEYACPAMIEIARFAAERDMVMSIHPSRPEDMSRLAGEVPGLKLVVAHLGGYGQFGAHLEMLRRYENVCFDYSAHGADRDGTLRRAIDCAGRERILFGTDYPGVGPAGDLAAVLHEDLTDGELEAVLSGNAKRLLHID